MISTREAAVLILEGRSGSSRASLLVDRMEPRDRALVQMLVSGVVKQRLFLDHVISSFSNRPLPRISARVLTVLRLGAFELIFSRTPPYAAVDSAVGCLRERGERSFANGVLRAIARSGGDIELPCIDLDAERYVSLRYSHPQWIAELFVRRFSLAGALALCSMDNEPPGLTLRVNRLRASPEAVLEEIRQAGISAEPSAVPGSIRVTGSGAVTALPGFREGRFVVQDEGATVISLALDPKPGERVWDVCSAPGGKTTHIAEMMGDRGDVLATDVDPERISMVDETVSRLGISIVRTGTVDAAQAGPGEERPFDRILVDAPCSGLGVLRRNADLRWNRRPGDIPAMAARQARILRTAWGYLKPGGTIVYSTCTLTREENEDVWMDFLEDCPGLEPEDPGEKIPPEARRLLSPAPFAGPGYRYLLPFAGCTDGFFVAKARRKG